MENHAHPYPESKWHIQDIEESEVVAGWHNSDRGYLCLFYTDMFGKGMNLLFLASLSPDKI